ncbi:replication restart helicase PriA [Veillonella agrestimuris]|uniref:replication restart helicase PriA n=1 Tax=Veillonella agrestimuris TaxID=2941340 RepID=UPI0020404D08|nr:primosomal protein N' [Veillonella agrestimuris]
MRVAQVIINRPAKQLNKPLSYILPDKFGDVASGTRLLVPLGGSREEGILIGYEELTEAPDFALRAIIQVLDSEPWFTKEMMDTAKQISQYYLCSYGDALRLFTVHKTLKSYDAPKEEWLVVSSEFSVTQFSPKKKKQRELAAYLIEVGGAPKSLLRAKGFSHMVIKQVAAEPGISIESRFKDTKTTFTELLSKEEDIPLTDAQASVYKPIQQAIDEHRYEPFLLHGVTGSGKTQVYLRAAARCIGEGKTAIILVPEIVLTDQIVRRFVKTFGQEVVVFHSKLTISERNNNWERIRRKDSHIIIGARSAIFAPAEDIGLIVLDEEHDTSYKQEDMIRYHARNVALWRAKAHQCPVILGSATPSIVSFYKAQEKEYTLLELPYRIYEQPMPEVHIIDMKEEMIRGNYSVFSDAMMELIESTLEEQNQMIMLLNRRGYSTFVMCRDCGETIMCPHCSVSMVYHQEGEELRCHYCDHHEPIPTMCPKCASKKIKFFGSGTQKVEEELRRHFKEARIARLDQDVTRRKHLAEDILRDFGNHKYDILLGTQMVSKGHDFKDVTAVGILTADSVLNIPLYSASERAFDLLTQTSGRAGRGEKEGRVVIQTYNPLNYAIIKSKAHDYEGFYNEEIANRRELGYPPFKDMIYMVVRHEKEDMVSDIAQRIVTDLDSHFQSNDIEIIGPYESGIKKIRNMYRLSIMIRGMDLKELKEYIYNSWIFTQEGLLIDVDPI